MRRRHFASGATPRPRRGAALLEVLVAITLVATVAVSALSLTLESQRAVERATRRAAESARAGSFLDAVALWPREDLDRHLGARAIGPWVLEVQRPERTLYVVALFDGGATHPLFTTTLYRAERRGSTSDAE